MRSQQSRLYCGNSEALQPGASTDADGVCSTGMVIFRFRLPPIRLAAGVLAGMVAVPIACLGCTTGDMRTTGSPPWPAAALSGSHRASATGNLTMPSLVPKPSVEIAKGPSGGHGRGPPISIPAGAPPAGQTPSTPAAPDAEQAHRSTLPAGLDARKRSRGIYRRSRHILAFTNSCDRRSPGKENGM